VYFLICFLSSEEGKYILLERYVKDIKHQEVHGNDKEYSERQRNTSTIVIHFVLQLFLSCSKNVISATALQGISSVVLQSGTMLEFISKERLFNCMQCFVFRKERIN
jgi:hypothetical protein